MTFAYSMKHPIMGAPSRQKREIMNSLCESELLTLLDDIRQLSFSVDEMTRQMNYDQSRVADLIKAMQDVSRMQTCFEKSAATLDEKIDRMKTLIDLP